LIYAQFHYCRLTYFFIKLEKDEDKVEPRLKLIYVDAIRH